MTLTTWRPREKTALKIFKESCFWFYLNTESYKVSHLDSTEFEYKCERFTVKKGLLKYEKVELVNKVALNYACGEDYDWTWESGYHVMAYRYWGTGTVRKAFYVWEGGFFNNIFNSNVILSGWLKVIQKQFRIWIAKEDFFFEIKEENFQISINLNWEIFSLNSFRETQEAAGHHDR